MDEPLHESYAYYSDICDIKNDEASDDASDELESVIQHELAKFHQQQAVKYAAISAAGQCAPLSLPSPAPLQQQKRAEERHQLEAVNIELTHPQQKPICCVPSPGALAVEQLWHQQTETQEQHDHQQQLRPSSSRRFWSAPAHKEHDTVILGHLTYSADAEHPELQKQNAATACGLDADLVGHKQSEQLNGCRNTDIPGWNAEAPYSDRETQQQAPAASNASWGLAGQHQLEQSHNADACSKVTGGPASDAGIQQQQAANRYLGERQLQAAQLETENVSDIEAPAVLHLHTTDVTEQPWGLQDMQHTFDGVDTAAEGSTDSDPDLADEPASSAEAHAHLLNATGAAELHRCQQGMQLQQGSTGDGNCITGNACMSAGTAVSENDAAVAMYQCPDALPCGEEVQLLQDGGVANAGQRLFELQQPPTLPPQQQQRRQDAAEVGQLHVQQQQGEEEGEAAAAPQVYSEVQQYLVDGTPQQSQSQQQTQEAVASDQYMQQQDVRSTPNANKQHIEQSVQHDQQQQGEQPGEGCLGQQEARELDLQQQGHLDSAVNANHQQREQSHQELDQPHPQRTHHQVLEGQRHEPAGFAALQQQAHENLLLNMGHLQVGQGVHPELCLPAASNSREDQTLAHQTSNGGHSNGTGMLDMEAAATESNSIPVIAAVSDTADSSSACDERRMVLPAAAAAGPTGISSQVSKAEQPGDRPPLAVVGPLSVDAPPMGAGAAVRSGAAVEGMGLNRAGSQVCAEGSGYVCPATVSVAAKLAAVQLPPQQLQLGKQQSGWIDACAEPGCVADELGIYQDPDECDDSSSCSTPAAGRAGPGSRPSGHSAAATLSPATAAVSCSPSAGTPAASAAAAATTAAADDGCSYGVQHAASELHSLSLNNSGSIMGACDGTAIGATLCTRALQPPEHSANPTQLDVWDAVSAWPTGLSTPAVAAYVGNSSSSSCLPHSPDEEQQRRRPVHSRHRSSGTQSPWLQAARGARMGYESVGSLGPVLWDARLRPGSAPCQQSLGLIKSGPATDSFSKGARVQQIWSPGNAAVTDLQVQQVYHTNRTAGKARSSNSNKLAAAAAAAAAGGAHSMSDGPHTSDGTLSCRSRSLSPVQRKPSWQVPIAEENIDMSNPAITTTARHHQDCGTWQQQQRLRPRPCSAPKARLYEPILQQSNAACRPYSSRASCYQQNWQQLQQQYKVLPVYKDEELASMQYWANRECMGGLQPDMKRGQLLQQQRQRLSLAWDASPIPLNTPKTVPIADATQPNGVPVTAKGSRGDAQCADAQHMHARIARSTAAVMRPRTAGSAGAAAIMREHPGEIGAIMPGSDNSSSGSNCVYLIEIQQKLKQANSCCRKVGLRRCYCMAPSTKARWNLEQITIQVWQFVAVSSQRARARLEGQQQQQQQQEGGWHLTSHLKLYQFNRQLDRLIARAAAQAAADSSAAGHAHHGYAAAHNGATNDCISNGTSLSSSPAGSRGGSPDRSRPASAAAQAAASLGIRSLPVHSAEAETGSRQSSRLSPRRQAALQQQQQQFQQKENQYPARKPTEMVAAATAGSTWAHVGNGAALLPYEVQAWLQEHL